jgi:hypothetical protein
VGNDEAMTATEARECSLRLTAEGTAEPCPGKRCPFWEPGGAVLESRCFIETLGVEATRLDVASYLLDVRTQIEAAEDCAAHEAAHREFSRRIGFEL